MLQWMGGSRRKVTASRKSTQKRQKQFFEQRKRQQQEQEAAGVESHVESSVAYDHQQGNRSLDILSLLNVPKVAEEDRPSMKYGTESSSTVDYKSPPARFFEDRDPGECQHPMKSPVTVTNEIDATDNVKTIGTRSPSSHCDGTMSSKSTSRNASKVRKAEPGCWRIDSSIEPSILDIIGDDEPLNTSKGKPVNEAHVAFSVEGLGDIGIETPKQSPRQPSRSAGGPSSFTKASKKLHLRKNLNSMLDELEMEVGDGRLSTNQFDSFPQSGRVLSPFSYPEHEQSTIKGGKNLGSSPWDINSIQEEREFNFYDAGSSFLDEVDDTSQVNWKNGDTTNRSSFWSNVSSSSLKFEEKHISPRFQDRATAGFDNLDETNHHFQPMEEPKFSRIHGYGLQTACSSPFIKMEDERDGLTLLSEESCSSSAVRGRYVAGMPSERCVRNGRDSHWMFETNAKENLHEGTQDILAGAARWREECDMSRKYGRRNESQTKSAYFSPDTDRKLQQDWWLREEEFPSSRKDAHPGCYMRSSENVRQQERDPFHRKSRHGLSHVPKSPVDVFEDEVPIEFSPENVPSFQPFCSRHSFNTVGAGFRDTSVEAGYRDTSLGVRHDSKIPDKSSNSSHVSDLFGDIETTFPVPELSAQGSVTEEVGDRPKSNPGKPTQVCTESLDATQESRSIAEETNWNVNESSFCKVKNGFHQDKVEYDKEDDTEVTSDSELNTKEFQGSTPVLCQQKLKVSLADFGCFMGKSVNDDYIKGSGAKTTPIKPSCQVMTVDRHVVQLFCVPKGRAAL